MPDGTAFFLTPNAPADFENPYHVYLFEPDDLREMLERLLRRRDGHGPRRHSRREGRLREAPGDGPQAAGARPARVFGTGFPASWFVALHAAGRRVAYRFMADEQGGGNSGITDAEFFTTERIDPSTLVLLAVARKPLI